MYYIISCEVYHPYDGARTLVKCSSLFNDYEICIEEREFIKVLNVSIRYFRREMHGHIYIVVDSENYTLRYFDSEHYKEFGLRGSSCVLISMLDLSSRFYKFLVRLVHDCDKSIASVEAVDNFVSDLESGASPLSLWSHYCWYRTFGHMTIDLHNDVLHPAAF